MPPSMSEATRERPSSFVSISPTELAIRSGQVAASKRRLCETCLLSKHDSEARKLCLQLSTGPICYPCSKSGQDCSYRIVQDSLPEDDGLPGSRWFPNSGRTVQMTDIPEGEDKAHLILRPYSSDVMCLQISRPLPHSQVSKQTITPSPTSLSEPPAQTPHPKKCRSRLLRPRVLSINISRLSYKTSNPDDPLPTSNQVLLLNCMLVLKPGGQAKAAPEAKIPINILPSVACLAIRSIPYTCHPSPTIPRTSN